MAKGGRVAEWQLKLKQEIAGEAEKAAKALDELREVMKRDKSELAELQQQMRALKAAGGDNLKQAMGELKTRIDQKRAAMATTRAEYKRVSEHSAVLKLRQQQLAAMTGQLRNAITRLPGPLGSVASRVLDVTSKMTSARGVAVGLAGAFMAVTAAATFATGKLAGHAIAAQNSRRNELLHLEALTKQRNLWGLMPGKASDMQAAIDRISASVSISREKVVDYAHDLYQAGLRGDRFAAALEGTSIKASALGPAAGSAFASWAGDLALTGGNVKRLSEDIKNRFGGVVQKQMKSLEVSALKSKEAFDSLFSGINIEGFLDELHKLRSMFAANTASGRALKSIIDTLLGPLINSVSGGLVILRRFFKQVIIGTQELIIAFLEVRNWVRRTFGSSTRSVFDGWFSAIRPGRLLVYGLAAAFGVMAVNMLAATWPLLALGAAFYVLVSFMQTWWEGWKQIEWAELGIAIIDGIVGGIKAGADWVMEQLSELAKDAKFVFKTVLGIESPSKVFAELGREIPAGVELGVKQGTPAARKVTEDLVTPKLPTAQLATSAAPPSSSRSSSSSSVQLTIGELHVHPRTDDPKGYAVELRRELESVLEGLSLQLGAAR